MQFQWQDHHFIAGRRCLDFANTVVYAQDPLRREDRLNSLADIEHWLACSPDGHPDPGMSGATPSNGGSDRVQDRVGTANLPREDYAGMRLFLEAMRARTAIDRIFRVAAHGRSPHPEPWRDLIAIHAEALRGAGFALEATTNGLALYAEGCGAPPFLAGITHDAITLALSPWLQRVKECPGCHWLFVDKTRNGRKRWCEMRTCGNRAKAHRYSERLRARTAKPPAASRSSRFTD